MKIPKRLSLKDYDFFVQGVGAFLEQHVPDACFYLHGSYAENRATPGVSDIDGGIVLNGGAVTNKEIIRLISQGINQARADKPLHIQWNLADRQTSKDGRFLSYDNSYTDPFKKGRAVIITGPDYLQEMNGLPCRREELHSAAHNFRRLRNALLFAETNNQKAYDQRGSLQYDLETALDKLTALPKKIEAIQKGRLSDTEKRNAPAILQRVLPGLNCKALDWAVQIRSDPSQFRAVVYNEDQKQIRRDLEHVVTGYEQIIKAYIEEHPQVNPL